MDRIKNPFTPGAGYLPPELAGRNQVIEDGQVVAMRTKLQRAERGLMLIGPRGVGKTVLLKCLSEHARENGIIPVISEIRNDKSDLEDLAQKLKEALYTLDFKCKVKSYIQETFSVLGNFVRKFSLNIGDVGVSIELHSGLGESGNMELDLSQVLLSAARAAKNSLSMMRRSLIKKGMIFSPSLGMVAYTVPMFGAYMMRMSSNPPCERR